MKPGTQIKSVRSRPLLNTSIVNTRPDGDSAPLSDALRLSGASVYNLPAFKVEEVPLTHRLMKIFKGLDNFDWIIFTSVHGVKYFLNNFRNLNNKKISLTKTRIAAVGPKTAAYLKKNDYPVDFVPSEYTSECLASEIGHLRNKRILLPVVSGGPEFFSKSLEKKGAAVTKLPVYRIVPETGADPVFENLLLSGRVNYLLFASGSAVIATVNRVSGKMAREKLCSTPVISIGQRTGSEASRVGFKTVIIAEVHTAGGMLDALIRNHEKYNHN